METFLTKKDRRGISLVVQWLRICRAMQGMQVRALIKIPQATGQLIVRAALLSPHALGPEQEQEACVHAPRT